MKLRILCSTLAIELLLSFSAFGTSLVRMSLEQLTQASSAVLQGRVVQQASQWNAAHTEIVTLTTIAVDKNVKGSTPRTVVVQQVGGTVGHIRVDVPGAVRFYPQSHYMLFLERAADSANYQVVGMEEGAYRIVSDPETHEERVVSPMGRVFYGKEQGSGEPASLPGVMPLDEFQQRVSKALSRPIVIPSGTAIPLIVRSVSTAGVARILVEARTTSDVFPDSRVVIPAGSVVDGWGREVSGRWTLYWTAVSIRGRQARISASNNAGARRNLRGEPFTAITR